MVSNLTCVAKSSLTTNQIQEQFAYICDPAQGSNCLGILGNGTTGKYGSFSMCNDTQRLSFAFNQYYLNQTATNSENNSPCDFKGAATKVSPAKLASSCKAVISQAGAAGTGSVTNAPTGTSISGSGSGSGTGSSSGSSSSSSKGAAVVLSIPAWDLGVLKLAAYVTSAVLVGAGMVLL